MRPELFADDGFGSANIRVRAFHLHYMPCAETRLWYQAFKEALEEKGHKALIVGPVRLLVSSTYKY